MKVHRINMEPTGSEGARRATEDSVGSVRSQIPDPEVPEKSKRRRFSAEYKLRILREADSCKGDGDVGALLRREGLYFSTLSNWRRQRNEIVRKGLAGVRRGRKAKQKDPRIKELERENAQLRRRLKRAETILEIQKKPQSCWGYPWRAPTAKKAINGSSHEAWRVCGYSPCM